MSVGNLLAYRQQDVKRLLAYSSVAHMGYIFSGISTGTSLGLEGAYFHILNHAFMKGLAFLCIGAYTFQSGVRDIDSLGGIGRKMPVTTICLSISLFSLMGIPPFSGFISEVLLFQSNIAIGNGFVAVAILINSILGSIYYVQLLQRFLTKKIAKNLQSIADVSYRMLLPLIVMTIILVSFTIFSGTIIEFLRTSVSILTS
jgi:formate hydrogenlyase subunit 3/multisubunit Na+/H+ antiporter MnhD subunit